MTMRVIAAFLVMISFLWGAPGSSSAECSCREPTDMPEIPPDNATSSDMARGSREIEAYLAGMSAYRDCLVGCIRSVERNITFITNEWNERVDRYNRGGTRERGKGSGHTER